MPCMQPLNIEFVLIRFENSVQSMRLFFLTPTLIAIEKANQSENYFSFFSQPRTNDNDVSHFRPRTRWFCFQRVQPISQPLHAPCRSASVPKRPLQCPRAPIPRHYPNQFRRHVQLWQRHGKLPTVQHSLLVPYATERCTDHFVALRWILH